MTMSFPSAPFPSLFNSSQFRHWYEQFFHFPFFVSVQHYSSVYYDFVLSDDHHRSASVTKCSVQLFTVASLVRHGRSHFKQGSHFPTLGSGIQNTSNSKQSYIKVKYNFSYYLSYFWVVIFYVSFCHLLQSRLLIAEHSLIHVIIESFDTHCRKRLNSLYFRYLIKLLNSYFEVSVLV